MKYFIVALIMTVLSSISLAEEKIIKLSKAIELFESSVPYGEYNSGNCIIKVTKSDYSRMGIGFVVELYALNEQGEIDYNKMSGYFSLYEGRRDIVKITTSKKQNITALNIYVNYQFDPGAPGEILKDALYLDGNRLTLERFGQTITCIL